MNTLHGINFDITKALHHHYGNTWLLVGSSVITNSQLVRSICPQGPMTVELYAPFPFNTSQGDQRETPVKIPLPVRRTRLVRVHTGSFVPSLYKSLLRCT